jgi:hypothetical protein
MTPHPIHDPLPRLCHDLKNPLTTVHARAQLQARAVRRSPSLPPAERDTLLAGLAAIEAAVLAAVATMDAASPGSPDGVQDDGRRPTRP